MFVDQITHYQTQGYDLEPTRIEVHPDFGQWLESDGDLIRVAVSKEDSVWLVMNDYDGEWYEFEEMDE